MPSGEAQGCSPRSILKTEGLSGWQPFLLSWAAVLVCFSQGQIFCPACDPGKLQKKARAEPLPHRPRALEDGTSNPLSTASFPSAGVDLGPPGEGAT